MVRSGRVHILIDYRPALRERTGVGEYVHRLTEAMVPQLRPGERLTAFSSSWKDRLTGLPSGVAAIDLRIPVSALNLAWHRFEWPRVERLGSSPDLTWSLHPLLMPASKASQAVTIHDLYFLDHPEHTAREIRRDYACLARAHARRADLVVVNSNYTRSQVIERLDVEPSRIVVCRPGVIAPESPARGNSGAGPILHLGSIEPRKNVHMLLRAYEWLASRRSDLPNLVLAGKVPRPFVHLATEAVRSRIHFLGYVGARQKSQLLCTASMLVVPSTDEGFGMPALEAMAHGLPVVAANRGALPEVLGDAGLLVDAASPESLGAAISRVLDHSELRLQMRTRGLERAAAFSWTRSAEALLDAFRHVYRRRGRRA